MGDLSQVFNPENKEDSVFYYIFPDRSKDPGSLMSMEELLFDLMVAARDIVGQDFIWQKDPFSLWINSGLNCFQGSTRYEYNVEDEWQIVKILKGLSEKFPDLIIRVFDTDGEFLLIEAADVLPDWAESDENCKCRVYLQNGRILLIPPEQLPLTFEDPDKDEEPMKRAISYLRSNAAKSGNDEINSAINSRINKMDMHKLLAYHEANAILPPIIARLLRSKPQLISSAVNAFFYRDPIDIKAARLMGNTKPGQGLVKTRVRFTRCLFSMISKDDFRPDSKTGWKFPPPNTPEFKSNSLGAKITLGFEIILSKGVKNESKDCSEQDWARFIESLKKKGYFRDYLEGSKPHGELLAKAKVYFNGIQWNRSPEYNPEDGIANEIRKLLQSFENKPEFNQAEMAEELGMDDDESWLDMGQEDLDKILEEHFSQVGDGLPGPQFKTQDIPTKLKEFISKMSDFSGVENTPSTSSGEQLSDAMKRLDKIEFRAGDFISAVDSLLNDLGKPDKDWDASDEEPYSDEEEHSELARALEKNFGKKDKGEPDVKMQKLMGEMDKELAGTEVGKTFKESEDEFGDVESFKPVNIDMNALKNILASYSNQEGPMSGPSSVLLSSVGMDLANLEKKKNGGESSKNCK